MLSIQQNNNASKNLSFSPTPWQFLAFWHLSLSHTGFKLTTSAADITSSFRSIGGRRGGFLLRGPVISAVARPRFHTTLLPLPPSPSQAKESGNIPMTKTVGAQHA